MLHISCPACSQRFKVGPELYNRTVECGTCEHRFLIEDEVILRGRKYYPGQRQPNDLGKLQRIQPQADMITDPSTHVTYGDAPDSTKYEPTSPLRIIAAGIGVAIMLLMMLVLMIGADRESILSNITTERRLVMAIFAAILGSGLLIYGNPKTRIRAVTGSLLGTLILVSLPFIFQGGSEVPLWNGTDLNATDDSSSEDGDPSAGKTDKIPLVDLIGTAPLEEEIARFRASNSEKTAIGLWLKNLVPSYQFLVRDFAMRKLGADHQTHYFRREHPISRRQSHLLVVSGTEVDFERIAELTAPIGEVTNQYPELSIVEIEVDNSNFVEGPINKLGDRRDPAFYELNKRELDSIDLSRVEKAVRRLMDAEPKIYQSDIQKRLIYLLQADYVEFKGEVCRALKLWGSRSKEEGEAGMAGLSQLLAKKKKIPTELIELIIKSGNKEVIPYLNELWKQSALDWENLYMLTDETAEPFVLRDLDDATGRHQQSAVRILGKIGTHDSIPTLTKLVDHPNVELSLLAKKSLKSIRERHGEP